MVVFRSGAGGAQLRLFEAGPAAPNLHLKNVLRVRSDVVSEPEADGARLRLLEPALLLRKICTSAPNFGAGSGFRSPGAAPTRCAKAHHPKKSRGTLCAVAHNGPSLMRIPLFGFRCNIGNININIGISFLVSWDFFGRWNFG